jgi:hypothetical protein
MAEARRAFISWQRIKWRVASYAATGGFKPDSTLDELREEIGKRVVAMAQAGLIDIDLAALPQPENSATAAQSVGAK